MLLRFPVHPQPPPSAAPELRSRFPSFAVLRGVGCIGWSKPRAGRWKEGSAQRPFGKVVMHGFRVRGSVVGLAPGTRGAVWAVCWATMSCRCFCASGGSLVRLRTSLLLTHLERTERY
ncbi:hypothetical protein ABB37_07270 [Leptomonas pyrrhocoris]|uniref:Uncharacterized protein n=1 Tax=Leptomonas pyrrhocoris TaxID=157538 RepID=A0A0M9FWI0_LEPPY|nr:hypothetical protein ABB37_07254 [Leptomonas pyrrhocoris]XP_015655832.1 hypothetical protein ABB37_07256 [Leptomonas pyrrhocoris]XP_015655834.1 hypothetical protein ABB37_07258 [Leptomonas pyrrhocoris]XP_015655836.1 hypothetical protein ABB37_07260 [Leptomonas pyrrhocoris]XP_015655838.1 hypothetical protein ABB37_07262 [Leptomonas pyrrhocoris]XP_015655840.1 hypothetical protein ABB37_07264 [Leptomonas pyrrhocoris]XP_015655843.1 hypothetical protein ABB37_07266 [Leptomonas pyrrhocoris]XP_0|eukprot:XP_015655830.1 hypothetical protein ABB37_07254 [Leptomonas pyrrhocoris]